MVWVAEGLQSCCSGLMELTTAAWVLLRIFLFGGLRDFFFLVAYASDWEMYMGWVECGLDGFHCVGFG